MRTWSARGLACVFGVCVCARVTEPVYAYKKNSNTQIFSIYTKMLIVSQQFLGGKFFLQLACSNRGKRREPCDRLCRHCVKKFMCIMNSLCA